MNNIITGKTYYPNPGGGGLVWIRPFLLAVNTEGVLQWEKALGVESYLLGRGFSSISDTLKSIYVFGTHYGEPNVEDEAPGLFKTDLQGNLLYDEKLVDNSVFGRASCPRWHNQDQLIVSGFYQNHTGHLECYISIVDTTGQMMDSINIVHYDFDPGNIEITYDKKYILAATKVNDNGTTEIVAMKLNRQLEYDTGVYQKLCKQL